MKKQETIGNAAAMREALTDLCNAALKVIVLRGHDADDLRSLGFYCDEDTKHHSRCYCFSMWAQLPYKESEVAQ